MVYTWLADQQSDDVEVAVLDLDEAEGVVTKGQATGCGVS